MLPLSLERNPWAGLLLTLILALTLALSAAGRAAAAEGAGPPQPSEGGLFTSEVISKSVLSLTYAQVITDDVPVYAHPSQAGGGHGPARSLGAGYLWVSLADRQPYLWAGQLWYKINEDEYIRGDHLEIYRPSTFEGVALLEHPEHPLAWVVYDTWASAKPGAVPEAGTPILPRYTLVTIFETRKWGEWNWYRIGKDQWIEQRTVGVVKPSPRPGKVKPADKWIEINLYEQTLAAYQGDRMVYATLVSSGLPWWQTEPGLFQVWTKVKEAKMSGREGYQDYYFLEDVPWAVYFNESTALHAAYWHDRFGYPHSHGCVNLPAKDAQWLFDWVTPTAGPNNWTFATEEDVGTWVWVHEDLRDPETGSRLTSID